MFIALTALPAMLIGGTLWLVSGLVPVCTTDIVERLTAPDNRYDLVVFSRQCGETGANVQAALIPAGEDLPEDAASFVSVGGATALAARWDGFGNIEVTLPPEADIYRQDDTVAEIAVIYR